MVEIGALILHQTIENSTDLPESACFDLRNF
jgi:hypothetical protein